MVSQRTIFTRGGVVVEISMCAPQGCDEWCRMKGYDGWVEATDAAADVLREVNEGDLFAATKVAGKPYALTKTATAAREGLTFVSAGVRDYAKLRTAQAAQAAKVRDQ